MAIYVGLGDIPEMRRFLSQALTEAIPAVSFLLTGCQFLEAFRDPEIHRLLFDLYGR